MHCTFDSERESRNVQPLQMLVCNKRDDAVIEYAFIEILLYTYSLLVETV